MCCAAGSASCSAESGELCRAAKRPAAACKAADIPAPAVAAAAGLLGGECTAATSLPLQSATAAAAVTDAGLLEDPSWAVEGITGSGTDTKLLISAWMRESATEVDLSLL